MIQQSFFVVLSLSNPSAL